MTAVTDRDALDKVEARIRSLHGNGGRFSEALKRRLLVRQAGRRTEITGDRRDAEGYAAILFATGAATRVESIEEDDPTTDSVILVLVAE